MAMQINGNYDYSGTDYAERVKEKQEIERAEKTKEAEKAAEEKGAGKLSEPQDEYISSEKSGKEPTGLYRVGRDENGNQKIFFADPKDAHADGEEPKAARDNQGKPAEICVGNTDKVDREIRKLKEKKQQLEQQIQSASGDETPFGNKEGNKIRELEKKLAQVERELSQKDNDTYRKQHTVFFRTK